MDEERDRAYVKRSERKKITKVTDTQNDRKFIDYILITTRNYTFKSWPDYFPDNNVTLSHLLHNPQWEPFFSSIKNRAFYKNIETMLSINVKKNNMMVPPPELLFNVFNLVSPNKISVVIVGQDPYIDFDNIDGNNVYQATGVSFSVPDGIKIPQSLRRIYENMIKYGHMSEMPDSALLYPWVLQGCFMFNAALTTICGKSNSHSKIWNAFTNELISYLDSAFENLVFVVWGKFAHGICQNVDPTKHLIITSAHPSPLSKNNGFNGLEYGNIPSCKKSSVSYPSFNSIDHFGTINAYLESKNKQPIFWDSITSL